MHQLGQEKCDLLPRKSSSKKIQSIGDLERKGVLALLFLFLLAMLIVGLPFGVWHISSLVLDSHSIVEFLKKALESAA